MVSAIRCSLMNHQWLYRGHHRRWQAGANRRAARQALQDLDYGSTEHSTQIYIKLDDPANTDAVIAQLQTLMPNYPIKLMADYGQAR